MDLLERIVWLQSQADPELSAWIRLKKLRELVERKVMINPGDMAFLNDLQLRLDNVECDNLGEAGGCKVKGIARCRHIKRFKACPYYDRSKPQTRGNPLAGLVGG